MEEEGAESGEAAAVGMAGQQQQWRCKRECRQVSRWAVQMRMRAADRDFRLSAANPRTGSNVIPQGVVQRDVKRPFGLRLPMGPIPTGDGVRRVRSEVCERVGLIERD